MKDKINKKLKYYFKIIFFNSAFLIILVLFSEILLGFVNKTKITYGMPRYLRLREHRPNSSFFYFPVSQQASGQSIDFKILLRHAHSVGVIVAGKNIFAARLGKGDGERAGAGANIGGVHRAARLQHMRQQVQTSLRRGVMARPEGEPCVHFDMVAGTARAWSVMVPKQKERRHQHGRQVLLAARHPVFVRHVFETIILVRERQNA